MHESFDPAIDRIEGGRARRATPPRCHCGGRTAGKPACIDHIFELPYAAKIAKQLANEPLKLAMQDLLLALAQGPLTRQRLMQSLTDHPYTRKAALRRLVTIGRVLVDETRSATRGEHKVMVRLA